MEQNRILTAIIEHWKDIGVFLTGIWVLILGGIRLYKKGFIPVRDWLKKMDEAAEQLKYNGGSSTKDMVKQIRDGQGVIIEKVDKISNRQTALIELNNMAMFENDADGKCIMVNSALCSLFGATPNQMYGYGWLNFIKDSDHERQVFENAIETDNEITRDYTIMYGGKPGNELQATYIAYIKRDEHGNIINITGKVFTR